MEQLPDPIEKKDYVILVSLFRKGDFASLALIYSQDRVGNTSSNRSTAVLFFQPDPIEYECFSVLAVWPHVHGLRYRKSCLDSFE
jgi:hypothetical protein